MKKGLIVVLALFGVLVVAAWSLLVGPRNRFVTAEEQIKASWSQVENVMQRRSDLIPNLVNTVKGYAKQEKEIFVQIAEARSKLAGAQSVPDKISANQGLDSALSRLLVVIERYPDLKSNQNFMALQDELAGTENRIAVERMRYNEALRNYNVMVRHFPSNIAARVFGFSAKEEYFEATPASKENPKVEF
ncbi:MAG: Protein LemA [Elusimicrobia bacterium]|nr:Protein LemA [Elusimicrobiota bacterium]